ncbi:hypothetical protein V6Z12_A05G396500 [Gossypium hirsutum]
MSRTMLHMRCDEPEKKNHVETISAISKPFEAPHSYKAKPLCNRK